MDTDSRDVAALGRAIVRRRTALGWKTYRLAQKAGVPDPFLRRIEEGSPKTLGIGTVARIAEALGTTTDALLIESGLMEPPLAWQPGRQALDVYLRETSQLQDDDIAAVTYLVRRLADSPARDVAESTGPDGEPKDAHLHDLDEDVDISNLAAHPSDEEAREQRRIAEGWTEEEAP